MYIVFSNWIQMEKESKEEAIKAARLNSAAVVDESGKILIDCRTAETENDERG